MLLRFSLLFLSGASVVLSLTSAGTPVKAAFTLFCRDDWLKNNTAIVELWDYSFVSDHKFLARQDNILVDGHSEYKIYGDAHNWLLDNYFLKIIHTCHTECAGSAWSYYPLSFSDGEWKWMKKGGYKGSYIREVPIDISGGHNYLKLKDTCG